MNTWRVRVVLGLFLLSLSACSLVQGGATPEKGEELESAGGGFVWRREGGIAGFCDVVTVAAGDVATVATCRADPPDALGSVELTAGQAAVLDELVGRLGSFEREQSDPATADALTITIVFAGIGDQQATDEDIAAIDALAIDILRVAAEQ